MRAIDNHTKLYGVIGHPLIHTMSPTIHSAAFEATGINAVYLAFDTLLIEKALDGLAAIGCLGLSVTIPYKEELIDYLKFIDPMAKKIGAVNTLFNKADSWVGYNTDGLGALRAIEEITKVSGKSCTILGAGGAARAIGFALKEKGCRITIIDMKNIPHLVLPLSAVALFAEGNTTIRNVEHLRIKESDRLAAIAQEWSKIRTSISEFPDGLRIQGGTKLKGATVDSHLVACEGLQRAE